MIIKSLNAATPSQQRRWQSIRAFIPRNIRLFYEGCPEVPGQMWYAERKALYETIRRYKPKVVCESGTWLGGGSTYFIAQALYDNGGGTLHTTETDPEFFAAAIQNYDQYLSRLRPFVEFHLGASLAVYPDILKTLGKVDILLLDGAEDSEATFREFQMFEPFLSPNAIVMAHDWFTEKTARLRPYLENSPEWVLKQQVLPPHSVGFVVFQRNTPQGRSE